MTKYQVVATNGAVRIKVGDPHEFMGLAEAHAAELRRVLAFVQKGAEVVITVETVSQEDA